MARKKQPKRKSTRFAKAYQYDDDANPVDGYLDGLSEDSARVMESALASVADILSGGKLGLDELAWHELGPEHVSRLRGRLQRAYSPSTANRYLTAVRSVMREAWRLGLVDHEHVARTMDVAPVRGEREVRGRAISPEDLHAVFQSCTRDENRAAGARDAAILAVLYGGGLRRSEAAGIELEDLDLDEGTICIAGRGEERVVYLPRGTLKALTRWLKHRSDEEGPLFCHVYKTGAVRIRAISSQLVYRVVIKRHEDAEVEAFTPHDLRRSHIADLLDSGVDLSTVSQQVGHSSVQTTARYDRRQDTAKQAANKLKVPL